MDPDHFPSADQGPPARAAEAAKVRVAVVCTHYYTTRLGERMAVVDDMVRAVEADILVNVINHDAIGPAVLERDRLANCRIVTVCHDNDGHEFGAYQAGLDHVRAVAAPDWVVFVNDTLAMHSVFPTLHRDRIGAAVREHGPEAAMCVGEIESLDRSYDMLGARSHRWLTTHGFALNRAALQVLQNRIYSPFLNGWIRETADLNTFFGPEVDPVLREHIAKWLLSPRSRHTWHRAAPLSHGNAPRMAAKARAVLQEKFLAAALERASASFLDVKGPAVGIDRLRRKIERALFREKLPR